MTPPLAAPLQQHDIIVYIRIYSTVHVTINSITAYRVVFSGCLVSGLQSAGDS